MKARDKFQELNLSNAFLFAAVMNDAEICRLVLEILTGEPVEAVNVQCEQSILFSSDFRSVRLDVYARDCLEVEYDLEMEKQQASEAEARRSQIGTGDRSEKIRTYNFPQGRVTDHRIKLTLHKLDTILNGDLDEVIDSLIAADQAARLANMNDE